ncbi:MAG: helix-turn-helix transcriptional regulator [Muribaculaceae bacterium]|nr:helix-turn-helix transcriptional regulator [Muribaculaceae bacterium]
MNDNVYMLADGEICRRIGKKIRELRLRQNITQMLLAEQSQISVSSLKKIENGDIGYFDSLLRVLRVLGELDVFSLLLKEEELSPNEYLKFVETSKKKKRKRAKSTSDTNSFINQEESEW